MSSPHWTAFDVIKGMLSFADLGAIPASLSVLHTAVHKLSLKPEYKSFLADYVFEHRSPFPFSSDFQTDLVNLEQAGHLSTPNPDFIRYDLKPKLRNTFEKYGRRLFSEAELASLAQMARDFASELAEASRRAA